MPSGRGQNLAFGRQCLVGQLVDEGAYLGAVRSAARIAERPEVRGQLRVDLLQDVSVGRRPGRT